MRQFMLKQPVSGFREKRKASYSVCKIDGIQQTRHSETWHSMGSGVAMRK